MMHDHEIQDALDRQLRSAADGRRSPGTADGPNAGDADRAAYAIVYAALADDTGFTLPPGFAESLADAAMPEPAHPPVFERFILPILLLVSAAVAVPAVVPQLARAFRLLLETPDGGIPAAPVAVLVLLLVASADRLARRGGWAPRM
jgi:hypothetical protein